MDAAWHSLEGSRAGSRSGCQSPSAGPDELRPRQASSMTDALRPRSTQQIFLPAVVTEMGFKLWQPVTAVSP